MKSVCVILFLLFSVMSMTAFADDEIKSANWLTTFISKDLVKAQCQIEKLSSKQVEVKEEIEIEFDFKTLNYSKKHLIIRTQNWDVLTNDGTENPPKVETRFSKSKITPWTNQFGKGVFTEEYLKSLKNWLVFNDLATILEVLAKTNYDDAINGFFYEDEMKWLKKQFKSEESSTSNLWRQLSFDPKGNITGLSTSYLKNHNDGGNGAGEIEISNESGERLVVQPVVSNIENIVSGILISRGDNSIVVYNRGLNFSLNKFCPELFPDPDQLEKEFLMVMNKSCKKGFERFDALANNE